jgi:uncharacterized short protein YbdD (DUF466 family)
MNAGARNLWRNLWRALRSITGDDAYDRYAEHVRREHPERIPMDRRAFYLAQQQRRFDDGPTGCC